MLAMMYGSADGVRYCHHCQRTTSILLDHATGDAICTECALVLGDACSSEPRCRDASAKDCADDGDARVCVAGVGVSEPAATADTLLPGSEVAAAGGGGIACSVGPPELQADAGSAPRMRGAVVPKMRGAAVPKTRGAVPDLNKALAEGFDAIADMAGRLGLADGVRDRGKEVLRKLEEAKACPKGRSRDALYAACLHTACRIEGSPRTLKELAAATPDAAATKRDIGKFINVIKRHLGKDEAGLDQSETTKSGSVVVRAGDYLLRYGSAIGMSDQEVATARRAASRQDESLDVRRNPQSIAAAIMYMTVQRSGDGRSKSVREVSAASGVSESTIKDACKDLCPHADLLFG